MTTSFAKIMSRYWDNTEALREHTVTMRPVAQQGVALQFAKFFKSLADLTSSCNPEERELGNRARNFVVSVLAEIADKGKEKLPEQVVALVKGLSQEAGGNAQQSLDVDMDKLTGVQLTAFRRMDLTIRSHDLLHRSALVTLVGFFEVLVADICHQYYRLHPQALSGDDKIISLNELKAFKSIEEALEVVIRDRVEGLLRGSMEDWQTFILKYMKVDMTKLIPCKWDNWGEVFQRRNLIVHNDGEVNHIYLSKLGKDYLAGSKMPPELGQRLEVEPKYLDEALDNFAIAGVRLIDQCWVKLADSEKQQRDTALYEIVKQSVSQDRWRLVELLCSHASQRDCVNESMRLRFRLLYWLAVQRQGRWQEVASEVSSFDTSACNPRFAICVHALRNDKAAFFEDLAIAVRAGLHEAELIENPIFESMRSTEEFTERIESLYRGKSLRGIEPILLGSTGHSGTEGRNAKGKGTIKTRFQLGLPVDHDPT